MTADLVVYAAASPDAVEPEHRIASLVHPATGELLDPTKLEDVAVWYAAVKEFEADVVVRAKRVAEELLYESMDRQGRWTIQAGGYTVTGESRARWLGASTIDADALRRDLDVMVDRDLLDADAVASWFRTETRLTPDAMRRMKAIGGDVAALLDAHSSPRESKRRQAVRIVKT